MQEWTHLLWRRFSGYLSLMAPTGSEEACEPILMWIEVDKTLSGSANQQWLIPQQYLRGQTPLLAPCLVFVWSLINYQ